VLHLAAAAGPGVQAKMRATGRHAQRRFAVDGEQIGLLPLVFAAPRVRAHPLGGQGAVDEHHFAIGAPRHALGIEVHGIDAQPSGNRQRAGRRRNRRRAGSS